jgi:transcriptional regulator with XRE-family HTH domain
MSINMDDTAADPVTQRIASRVRQLRADAGLSLDALAAASGVSRSALSLIERAQSSPTAVVLDRIAVALGVPLASLFDGPAAPASASPLARRAEQPVWQDPASGYVRRAVSPIGYPSPIQIVEVEFPPGAMVAYEATLRERTVHEQLWVLQGRIDFTVGLPDAPAVAGRLPGLAARPAEPLSQPHAPAGAICRGAGGRAGSARGQEMT